jgi:hypothetical protein
MNQDDAPKDLKAICNKCFYQGDCSLKPTSKGQCNIFLKKEKIEMGDNISVSPMDTFQMSYDDLKDLLKELDSEA